MTCSPLNAAARMLHLRIYSTPPPPYCCGDVEPPPHYHPPTPPNMRNRYGDFDSFPI